MAVTCLIFYVLSAILGGILSWLLFGHKGSQLKKLKLDFQNQLNSSNELIAEFDKFKNEAKVALQSKDTEISRLKKISNSAIAGNLLTDDSGLKKWKEKAASLEKSLNQSNSQAKLFKKTVQHLEQENLKATEAIKALQAKLTTQKASDKKALTSKARKDLSLAEKQELKKIKKAFKKYKKRFRKLKKQQAKTKSDASETIEIRESLDLEKLATLLKQGKLTKKTKKLVKKKSKSNS